MDDDRPPVERSARKPPSRDTAVATSTSQALFAQHRRPNRDKYVDPRFDPMFGKADKVHFANNYKFLTEQRDAEQQSRLKRIRQLQTVLRRLRVEAAMAEENNGEIDEDALDEYNFSEEEEEAFVGSLDAETTTAADIAMARRDLAMLRRTPIDIVERELEQLKRGVALHKSQIGDAKAKSKSGEAKKRIIKEEVKAVKEGTKKRVFFPKRVEIKRRVAEQTFDELQGRGGKQLVDKYLERKRNR